MSEEDYQRILRDLPHRRSHAAMFDRLLVSLALPRLTDA